MTICLINYINENKFIHIMLVYYIIIFLSDSIADSGASAASNGGEWELMHYVH